MWYIFRCTLYKLHQKIADKNRRKEKLKILFAQNALNRYALLIYKRTQVIIA